MTHRPLTPEQAIARLEAWAEYHHAAAMRCPDDETCRAHQNQRDNYREIAECMKPDDAQ